MAGEKIKVLIVDDSAVVRKALSTALSQDEEIEVVGTAIDPYVARDKILKLNPDVLTLDIEMPRMDGLTFLKILMEKRPMPVIVMSSLTQAGSEHALRALQLGAVEVMAKPDGAFSVGDIQETLAQSIKAAAHSKVRKNNAYVLPDQHPPTGMIAVPRPHPVMTQHANYDPRQVILLGASTGGTEALKDVLVNLPKDLPGICIVQHIPAYFSRAFANRLNDLCEFDVKEAENGDRLREGLALVAPGDFHMILHWKTGHYCVELKQGPKVWHQRPAVDILFSSGATCAGEYAVAALLTGMGRDGAEGLLKLKNAGALTYAQDEASCVVFGMPRVAMELDAAREMVPLERMHEVLIRGVLRQRGKSAKA